MATSARAKTTQRASEDPGRGSLYPPGHRQSNDPYYLDDTLDAHPPLRRLFPGKPTAEAIAAAKRLAAERGYPLPQFPPESEGGSGDRDTAAEETSSAWSNGASRRLKPNGTARTAPEKRIG